MNSYPSGLVKCYYQMANLGNQMNDFFLKVANLGNQINIFFPKGLPDCDLCKAIISRIQKFQQRVPTLCL